MIDVHFTRTAGSCPWPDGTERMRVRAIDIARAAAFTVASGPGRSLTRRIMHTGAVALEVLAHLRNDARGDGLHAVGLDALDATARAEVVQRLGVGLARVVAERSNLGLVDFYNLDALAADPLAPVQIVRRVPHSRRRPDFAGQDATGSWSLLEAKGRALTGQLSTAALLHDVGHGVFSHVSEQVIDELSGRRGGPRGRLRDDHAHRRVPAPCLEP